jgi:diacylglycerol kinase family enzyme
MGGQAVRNRDRLAAIVALLLLALLGLTLVAFVITDLAGVVVGLVGLALLAAGAWWVITEQMPRRALGIVGALGGAALMVGSVVLASDEGESPLLKLLVLAVLAVAAGAFVRIAVVSTLRRLDLAAVTTPFRPQHPVLLANPRSGGGKVARFQLAERARALGVEVVLLEPGLDLEQLARDAVARGADCLGMAGGDGSQALVASVAIEHGLPFVCISAGTRNHFALDLGLDRDDPSTGLPAFTDGVLRRVDIARASGRLFVNNASLGVYAEVVEHDEYRDAKLATAAATLPQLLGARSEPFDLQFTAPDGHEVDGSFVILVSNNPYVLGATADAAQRRSLTTGTLGVMAISARTGREAAALATLAIAGAARRDPNLHEFTAERFEVRSRSGSARIGVDGEALEMPTPISFTIEPGALTLLVPPDNLRETLTKHYRALGIDGLLDIARGREPRALEAVGLQAAAAVPPA